MRLDHRSAPNTHVDMSLLPTTKHLEDKRQFFFFLFSSSTGFQFHCFLLGIVCPVNASGFIIRTVITLVQHKGVKLSLLPGSMVHQSYVFFCDNKLPDGTVTEIRIPGQQTKNKAIQCGLTAILTCRQVRNGCCSQACGSGNDEEWLV